MLRTSTLSDGAPRQLSAASYLASASPASAQTAPPQVQLPQAPLPPPSDPPQLSDSAGGRPSNWSSPRARRPANSSRPLLCIPSSASLVGELSPYRFDPPPRECGECRQPGHMGFECARRFLRLLGECPPMLLPDGSRKPSAWRGDAMIPEARLDLAAFVRRHNLPMAFTAPISIAVLDRGVPPPPARRVSGVAAP